VSSKSLHLKMKVCFHPYTPDEKQFAWFRKYAKKGNAGLAGNNIRKTITKQAAYMQFILQRPCAIEKAKEMRKTKHQEDL